jgi:hypothetical protein
MLLFIFCCWALTLYYEAPVYKKYGAPRVFSQYLRKLSRYVCSDGTVQELFGNSPTLFAKRHDMHD